MPLAPLFAYATLVACVSVPLTLALECSVPEWTLRTPLLVVTSQVTSWLARRLVYDTTESQPLWYQLALGLMAVFVNMQIPPMASAVERLLVAALTAGAIRYYLRRD